MRKVAILIMVVALMTFFFVGCANNTSAGESSTVPSEATESTDAGSSSGDASGATYEDGVYYARADISDSWTYFVVITVDGGAITDAYWGGTNFVPQGDKRVLSENHEYGMVENGGAQSYWYEQAEAAEAWLIENQDPAAFDAYTDEEGHTDALKTDGGATVSVHVSDFFTLAAQALASDPIPAGNYGETRVVTEKGEPSDNGWQDLAEFIVVNGTIVACDYDAIYTKELVTEGGDANAQYFDENGNPLSKDQLKEVYGMAAAGSDLEWYQQAELLENYIVENQDIYPLTDDGHADGVSGVSIHANGLVALFNEAFGS